MVRRTETGMTGFSFPWRYFVPRKGYFGVLKAAGHPQVRKEADRQAFMLPLLGVATLIFMTANALRRGSRHLRGRKGF